MRLSRALREKRLQYANRLDKVILQYDNARPHTAAPVKTYLETLKWEVLPHPPYSSDIALLIIYIIGSLQHGLADSTSTTTMKYCKCICSYKTVNHLLFSCPAFLRHRIQTVILLGLTHLNPTSMAILNLSMELPDSILGSLDEASVSEATVIPVVEENISLDAGIVSPVDGPLSSMVEGTMQWGEEVVEDRDETSAVEDMLPVDTIGSVELDGVSSMEEEAKSSVAALTSMVDERVRLTLSDGVWSSSLGGVRTLMPGDGPLTHQSNNREISIASFNGPYLLLNQPQPNILTLQSEVDGLTNLFQVGRSLTVPVEMESIISFMAIWCEDWGVSSGPHEQHTFNPCQGRTLSLGLSRAIRLPTAGGLKRLEEAEFFKAVKFLNEARKTGEREEVGKHDTSNHFYLTATRGSGGLQASTKTKPTSRNDSQGEDWLVGNLIWGISGIDIMEKERGQIKRILLKVKSRYYENWCCSSYIDIYDRLKRVLVDFKPILKIKKIFTPEEASSKGTSESYQELKAAMSPDKHLPITEFLSPTC
ncbi:TMEM62 [Cordylochernes scorpioides]|uniref:TMEM62 n=1 Tax=Cordylochernes scorpioides TaxID=51811 RepID=A0ABY6LE71_9ARAC|nr:TMEM62 [Cordylochernes scorpioides]